MSRKKKKLTEEELTGESLEEVYRGIEAFAEVVRIRHTKRVALMRKARGIWKDRQDFSNLADLRSEWDRFGDSR